MNSCPLCGAQLPPPVEGSHVDQVIFAVARVYHITRAELMAKDRHKSIAEARQVAMYLTRRLTHMSFPEIGIVFGNRDHTTVMSAFRKMSRTENPGVLARIAQVLTLAGATDPLRKTTAAAFEPQRTEPQEASHVADGTHGSR